MNGRDGEHCNHLRGALQGLARKLLHAIAWRSRQRSSRLRV